MAPVKDYILDKVENIVGKGENAGFQHFLLFPHCFQKYHQYIELCGKGFSYQSKIIINL